MEDALSQFLFEGHAVRGAFVDIRSGLNELLDARHYPSVARALLGQALAASPLLASNLKFEGRISLQFQGNGVIKLLVTQIDEILTLRGMLKIARGELNAETNPFDGGILSLIIEPTRGSHRYQAMVPVESACLAGALEGYYRQSEQLPTVIRLAAADHRVSGMMLQQMPGDESETHTDYWTYLTGLFETLGENELLSTEPPVLLRRLFHAETIRLFAPRPVTLSCKCSDGVVSEMLKSLGTDELNDMLADRGGVEVTCEFCRRTRVFSEAGIREILDAGTCEASATQR